MRPVALAGILATSLVWAQLAAARNPLVLCEKCLKEPLETDYYGPVGAIPRFTNYSASDFWKAALQGTAMVVSDAMKGAKLAGWSCEKLSQELPEAKMRLEYDWRKNPEDRNLQRLGDASWITAQKKGEDAEVRKKQDSEVPPYSPFYWGVREYRGGSVGPKHVIDKFRNLISESVPYFAEKRNALSMFENTEMWLGAQGAGARAHMDSHCISTLGYVLKGSRRWRIGPVPRMPPGAGKVTKDVVFDDGVAYRLKWKPFYEFELSEGEALFFPPGWIHETKNLDPGCTCALVTQFNLPPPIAYYRSYYNRVRRTGDLKPCYSSLHMWANLGEKAGKKFKRYDDASKDGEAKWSKIDADGDGVAKVDDFKKVVSAKDVQGLPCYEGSFYWYDLDLDGQVTKEEFVDTYARWSETEFHIAKEKELRPDKFAPDVSFDAPTTKSEL